MLMEMIQKREENDVSREREEICLRDVPDRGWNRIPERKYLLSVEAQINLSTVKGGNREHVRASAQSCVDEEVRICGGFLGITSVFSVK